MTHTQKATMLMALAVYAEHCNQMMSLLKNKETEEYYKKTARGYPGHNGRRRRNRGEV